MRKTIQDVKEEFNNGTESLKKRPDGNSEHKISLSQIKIQLKATPADWHK
jgi:hypothetical protein